MNKERQSISVKRLLAIAIGLAIVSPPSIAKETQSMSPVIQQYCVLCHNDVILQAGMSLQHFDVNRPEMNPVLAEKMILKFRAGMMPPQDAPKPDKEI